jgi:hypothetical protein
MLTFRAYSEDVQTKLGDFLGESDRERRKNNNENNYLMHFCGGGGGRHNIFQHVPEASAKAIASH